MSANPTGLFEWFPSLWRQDLQTLSVSGTSPLKGAGMATLGGRAFVSAVAGRRCGSRQDTSAQARVGLRFAFYGRMSTSEFQDAVTSRAWQRSVSGELIEGFGAIVVEFFDEG